MQRKQEKRKAKRKILIGPKNNHINFYRILRAQENDDEEAQTLTTLMIKNIPVKFTQNDMIKLLDGFKGKYNFFYLPMDLATKCNVGFAFVNMIHPLFILDFFLEFHCQKWSETVPQCNSQKYCEIMYANMQGIDEIKKELHDKNIMKKNDNNIKPILIPDLHSKLEDLEEIKYRCTKNKEFVSEFKTKLNKFE